MVEKRQARSSVGHDRSRGRRRDRRTAVPDPGVVESPEDEAYGGMTCACGRSRVVDPRELMMAMTEWTPPRVEPGELERLREEERKASRPLLEELRSIGVDVDSVWNLRCPRDYPQ